MGDLDEYAMLEAQLEAKDRPEAVDANGRDSGEKKERKEKRSSHRDEKDRKHRHRSRSRSKERDHKHRSSKDRDKDRDRDRDRDRGREKDRHKSRDRDRGGGEKDRHRSSSRRHKSPSPLPPPYRGRPPPRAPTPPEVIEAREREKELKELDRDTRTVFAYNLNLKADERDLFEFFSQAGEVMDVRIIMDRNTRRSKGFAYIEMATRESIIPALSLAGQTLMGQSVMVKSSEAEKNLAWEAAQTQNQQMAQFKAMAGLAPGTGPVQVTIRNVHPAIGEEDLRGVCAPFGQIVGVSITKDASGRGVGSASIQFSGASEAEKAVQNLDGLDIAGMRIKVEMGPVLPGVVDPAMAASMLSAGFGAEQPGRLDDQEDGGGLRMSADARALLMQRLAGESLPAPPPLPGTAGAPAGLTPPQQAAPVAPANPLSFVQSILGPASPIPTPCLVLKGMFDPAEETEPDWDLEIAADTKEECAKFGQVLHLHVDRNSKGFVYVKFATQEASLAAQRALHGRWFAGRQICAEYQFAHIYSQHFQV